MKLRLRSLETKETLKIDVPTPCSLHHLKQIVSQQISSSSAAASSVHLSLNRKDELVASSPQDDSLQSLGVTSGDLIFFTLVPNVFSYSQTLIPQSHTNPTQPNSILDLGIVKSEKTLELNTQKEQTLVMITQKEETLELNTQEEKIPELNTQKEKTLELNTQKEKTLELNTQKEKTLESNTQKEKTLNSNTQKEETLELNTQKEETLDSETPDMSGTENMDIDDEDGDNGTRKELVKSFSVPRFLRRVFTKEVGEGDGSNHKLLVIAVHAVLLESGFVAFDSVSKTKVEGFYLPDQWPTSIFIMRLKYTLPEIIDRGPSPEGFETVHVKFQSMGKHFGIYGSLVKNGSRVWDLRLDEERAVFFLNLIWANYDPTVMNGKGSLSDINPEREAFEFWKSVKDKLALPLLIDLCEMAGLSPPPCFMCLPTELKVKILESLPGFDVARVGCVCSELRYLSSNDDLWKQKFVEKFGDVEGSQGGSHWKEKFARSWETRKRRKTALRVGVRRPLPFPIWGPRIIRDPNPFGFPRIIGGDYDIGPDFPLGRLARGGPWQNVMPRCDLERNDLEEDFMSLL